MHGISIHGRTWLRLIICRMFEESKRAKPGGFALLHRHCYLMKAIRENPTIPRMEMIEMAAHTRVTSFLFFALNIIVM